MRRLAVACLLAALVFPAAPAPVAEASPSSAPTPLQTLLDRRVGGFSGGAGIVVVDPVTGALLYAHDPDQLVITASLYKLAVLVEAERRVETGKARYADPITIEPEDITDDGAFEPAGTTMTLDEALERMITVSDNGAALALERIFGPHQINLTLTSLGIQPFTLAENDADDNVASPRAVANYFLLLAQHRLVSRAASDRMVQRLERQQVNDRLPAQLPAGTLVAHKTGNLGFVPHDAGIIFGKNGDEVVVVGMTWNSGEEEAVNLIRDVGSLVYANAVTTPTNVGYGLPQQPVPADAGRPLVQTVRVTNLGPNDWTVSTTDPFRLIWEIDDAKGVAVSASNRPILLWDAVTSALAALAAPSLRGAYNIDIFAVADGHLASAPVRRAITIEGPRTYPGELGIGEGRGANPTPRPTPRPQPGKTPAGKTPLP